MTWAGSSRRRGSTPLAMRLLLFAGFALGAAATVIVMLFGDRAFLLRIAVLMAIWAALITAFVMVVYRRDAQSVTAREAEIARTYELELHREVTARREFEATFTAKVREELSQGHSDDLRGLREQLERLTSTLSSLMDGDLLVERLTLSAEATRVRGLGEGNRRLTQQPRGELIRSQDEHAAEEDDDTVDAEVVEDDYAPAPAGAPGGVTGNGPNAEPTAAVPRAGGATAAPKAQGAAVDQPAAEAPRLDAPSTAWTRSHRRDTELAAAAAAEHRADLMAEPDIAGPDHAEPDIAEPEVTERGVTGPTNAASDTADREISIGAAPFSTFSVIARGPMPMPDQEQNGSGAQSTPDAASDESEHSGGHELEPEPDEDDQRISVSDLLAAFGASATTEAGSHRRRRRAAD